MFRSEQILRVVYGWGLIFSSIEGFWLLKRTNSTCIVWDNLSYPLINRQKLGLLTAEFTVRFKILPVQMGVYSKFPDSSRFSNNSTRSFDLRQDYPVLLCAMNWLHSRHLDLSQQEKQRCPSESDSESARTTAGCPLSETQQFWMHLSDFCADISTFLLCNHSILFASKASGTRETCRPPDGC